jgi:predicted lipid-binding transport protein (Tim44 family)
LSRRPFGLSHGARSVLARGSRELSHLCDAEVARSFIDAIDDREAAGETFDNRLVRIEETQVVGASYNAPFARVSIRFVADVAAVTRDPMAVIGSLNDAVEVRDVWTFRRDINSADPDWLLEETDEG